MPVTKINLSLLLAAPVAADLGAGFPVCAARRVRSGLPVLDWQYWLPYPEEACRGRVPYYSR